MVRRWLCLALTVAAGLGVLPAMAVTAEAATYVDPAQNVVASPSYWRTCVQAGPSSQTCVAAVVAAIDNARSLEGVPPLVLPDGFAALSTPVQTFIVTNLERVDRGLPAVAGKVDSLNALSAGAAAADTDPMLSGWSVGPFQANGWSSSWAGDLNALAADYDWMYNDGWSPSGSINLDCATPSDSGCWGHRHAILRSGAHLITGVGSEVQSGWTSIAQIFVAGSGANPPFTVSWADVTGDPAAPTDDGSTGTTTTGATTTGTTSTGTSPPDPGVINLDGTDLQPTAVVPTRTQPTVFARQGFGRSVVATVDRAQGLRVRLRRHTSSGWHTIQRVAATHWMEFDNLRAGRYRVVVVATQGTARAVAELRLS